MPKTERLKLFAAHNRVLAEPLVATVNHPSLDDSALDGYAVRIEDTRNATADTPVQLQVVGEIAAGAVPLQKTIVAGQAIKIFTGAPVPPGTTGIVMVENTKSIAGGFVQVLRPATADIRKAGQDLQVGHTYLQPGTILRAPQIALAAAMGHAQVLVYEQPKFIIFSTGDEIAEPGEKLAPGGAFNSNAYGLAALVAELGGTATILPRTPDDLELLAQQLASTQDAHMLLTSGGVSMGERDMVRMLLERETAAGRGQIHFWRINIKPGGPALLGEIFKKLLFGLPGNPVASLIVFKMILRPAVYKRWGITEPAIEKLNATCATPFTGAKNKTSLLRAKMMFGPDGYSVVAFDNQSSGVLRSLTECNALVLLPPDQNAMAGDTVQVITL